MTLPAFRSRVVPVISFDSADDALPVAEALLRGGIDVIEVTLRRPGGLPAIARLARDLPAICTGAGTLLGADELRRAREAGAAFGLLQSRSADPLVADLLDEIQRHLDRPLTLASLAQRAGYSQQHLNRVFQRVLGTTPLKYLAATRLERAADLLRDQRLTVAEVARRVGIPDPTYFSRQFVRRFGATPSAYREGGGSESPGPGSRVPG